MLLKRALTSGALVALLAACAQTPDRAAPQLATADTTNAAVRHAMADVPASGMAVAVIDAGQTVYLHAFGRRNAAGEPLRTDTVMVAASLTKPVFAYFVMQLVDEGRIDLDTPIERYLPQPLPSYPPWSSLAADERWRAITPRMLLSHRSGLPNLPALEPDRRVHLHFDPGARFAYSGAGINLLQFVLERGLGLDVDAELRRRVFRRFDMRRTSMTWQQANADNQADGTTQNGEPRPHPHRQRAAAASSMDTTVEDYARFVAGLVRGDGLSAVSRAAMTASQGPITTATEFPTLQPELPAALRRPDLATGLGVVVFDGPQGPGFFKGGHEDFAGNTFVCLTRSARCVVLLSNDVRAERAFPGLVAAILGETGAPWRWEYGY
ncbi:serine hydrolase domain-containing protein [Ralstonia wenshanensis]|uniref:serine hydrolase domain-containing protein n=1 Tax=Ralstonia wenshanensis TaxID=2842456 RepID=UPI003D98A6D8